MNHGKHKSPGWLPVAALVLAIGCGSTTGTSEGVRSLTVTVGDTTSRSLTINKGDHTALTVIPRDAGGDRVIPSSPLSYTSRKVNVATVTSAGVVYALTVGHTYVVVSLSVDGRTLLDSIPVSVNSVF